MSTFLMNYRKMEKFIFYTYKIYSILQRTQQSQSLSFLLSGPIRLAACTHTKSQTDLIVFTVLSSLNKHLLTYHHPRDTTVDPIERPGDVARTVAIGIGIHRGAGVFSCFDQKRQAD